MLVRIFTTLGAPVAILVVGLLLAPQDTPAKPDYTRRTRKDCEFCHPPNSRLLNDAGKYYQEHRNSLEGYKPKQDAPKEPAKDAKTAPKK
jgi:hypothetical protein